MKRTILLLSLFFILSQNISVAQEIITAKIENWDYSEGKVVSLNLFSGETRDFGEIDSSGTIKIPLQDDFLSKVREEMKEKEESNPDNVKISLKNLKGTYSCTTGDLTYSDENLSLTGLPKMFFVTNAKNDIIGLLMPVSNPAIAEHHASFGKESTGKGKYVQWVYFEDKARVSGKCSTTKFAYTDSTHTSFQENRHLDLNFKRGWNLVEHDIQEIFKDSSGKIYPKRINSHVVETMPKDVQWTFIDGSKL